MRTKQIDEYHSLTDTGFVIVHKQAPGRHKPAGTIWKGTITGCRKYRKKGCKYMHRLIWEAFNGPTPKGHHIHHVDGDGHNNALSNLRCVTPSGNHMGHRKPYKGKTTSKYRGVSFCKLTKLWTTQVCRMGVRHNGPRFEDELEAAITRDSLARDLGYPEDGMNFPNVTN